MNPGQDALRGLFEKILGTPRVIDKIIRFKDVDDGVVFKESSVTGLHQGMLRTAHITERGVLPCGCVARPAIQCTVLDEGFPEPHLACSDCAFACSSCNRPRCNAHRKELDGQAICTGCMEKAKPFLFFKQIFAAIGETLG